jgi:hypothetical protein
MKEHDLHGKETSNGICLWGETLNDFYYTHHIPDCPYLCTLTTGSRMATWVRSIDEVKYAEEEIDWADNVEGDPVQLILHDVGEYIEGFEAQVQLHSIAMIQESGMTSEEKSSTDKETSASPTALFDPRDSLHPGLSFHSRSAMSSAAHPSTLTTKETHRP